MIVPWSASMGLDSGVGVYVAKDEAPELSKGEHSSMICFLPPGLSPSPEAFRQDLVPTILSIPPDSRCRKVYGMVHTPKRQNVTVQVKEG